MRDFNNTLDILVKAYLNDTLVHGNCYACAVGNMVAAGLGHKYVKCEDFLGKKITWAVKKGMYRADGEDHGDWFSTVGFGEDMTSIGKKEIEATGYSVEELRRIERAFERADCGYNPDEWMFNGLMAVVDVLADIHEISLEKREESKLMFVK